MQELGWGCLQARFPWGWTEEQVRGILQGVLKTNLTDFQCAGISFFFKLCFQLK